MAETVWPKQLSGSLQKKFWLLISVILVQYLLNTAEEIRCVRIFVFLSFVVFLEMVFWTEHTLSNVLFLCYLLLIRIFFFNKKNSLKKNAPKPWRLSNFMSRSDMEKEGNKNLGQEVNWERSLNCHGYSAQWQTQITPDICSVCNPIRAGHDRNLWMGGIFIKMSVLQGQYCMAMLLGQAVAILAECGGIHLKPQHSGCWGARVPSRWPA